MQVNVVAIDSKYTAEGAAAAANTLAGQGVKFIIGPIGSPELTGVKPIAKRNSMLVMGNGYAKDALSPQLPLVFHMGPGPSGWADPIIKIAKQKFGMKSVVLIAPNDQGGTISRASMPMPTRKTASSPSKNIISAAPPISRRS